MFQVEVKVNSFEKKEQMKIVLEQKLIGTDFTYLNFNQGQDTFIVGFNDKDGQNKFVNYLKNDKDISIINENNSEDFSDYEIIYNKQDQVNFIQQEKVENEQKQQDTTQNQQEQAKSTDSIQDLSFNSSENDNQEEQNQQEVDQNRDTQIEEQRKLGSSNTVESIQSPDSIKNDNQIYGDNFEATVVQSPLISEEENDEQSSRIYINICKMSNGTKEQRNALNKAFTQASEIIKKRQQNCVKCDEDKKKDLFINNILYNSNYQLLAFGIFSIYVIFL